MQIDNLKVDFITKDITDLKVDAIVNPANTELVMGGGLALVIKNKAGESIENEARNSAPIELGDSMVTTAGRLEAGAVIHTATMKMDFKPDQHIIRKAFKSALVLAEKRGFETIAMPALGCGTGKFSLKDFAKIAVDEVLTQSSKNSPLQNIIFTFKDHWRCSDFKESFLSYYGYQIRKLSKLPLVTVDAIVSIDAKSILLIERNNPPYGLALPGGFLEYGESLEDAIKRELKEETSLEIVGLKQFHTYSAPERDPRFHTVTTVFIADVIGAPKADSDAKAIQQIAFDKIPAKEYFAFDHWQIVQDWLKSR